MKRAIVIVLDGCGAGEAPDAADFGDLDHPSTIEHVWNAVGGIDAPNLQKVGFFAAGQVAGTAPRESSELSIAYGRLRELSVGGKDSVTGHWEMMGIVTNEPFPTYPKGFPIALVKEFERRIGTQVLGNRPASGTQIIAELGEQHVELGFPILYTSADSVFQIACHEDVVPVPRLYEMCEIAREMLVKPHNVQRVIARPFIGDAQNGFKRTEHRKDFPLPAPPNLLDSIGDVFGIGVVPELFAGRGFRQVPRTQNNAEHAKMLDSALESESRFIFANFEDTDMLFGHRNDAAGFAGALKDFDSTLGMLLQRLKQDDLLIVTADHGNDPTTPSTDHSREFVPFCCVTRGSGVRSLGDLEGMTTVGATVAHHLGVEWEVGVSVL